MPRKPGRVPVAFLWVPRGYNRPEHDQASPIGPDEVESFAALGENDDRVRGQFYVIDPYSPERGPRWYERMCETNWVVILIGAALIVGVVMGR